jgi:hypothetical protein
MGWELNPWCSWRDNRSLSYFLKCSLRPWWLQWIIYKEFWSCLVTDVSCDVTFHFRERVKMSMNKILTSWCACTIWHCIFSEFILWSFGLWLRIVLYIVTSAEDKHFQTSQCWYALSSTCNCGCCFLLSLLQILKYTTSSDVRFCF